MAEGSTRSTTDWDLQDVNETIWFKDGRGPEPSAVYVTSVFGRSGIVEAELGDYESALVTVEPYTDPSRPWGDVRTYLTNLSSQIDDITASAGSTFNVLLYGASTTAADNQAAFQAAINAANAAGGGVVTVPAGIWKLLSGVTLYEDVTFKGDGIGATILDFSLSGSAYQILATGSYGTEMPIAAAVDSGATTLTTTGTHGFAVGDHVLLKSQRDVLTPNAGAWQLGVSTGTAGSLTSYFAEWIRPIAITSTTAFDFKAPLLFPGYRPDATQDTLPPATARASATVAKITPVTDIVVQDMTLIMDQGDGTTNSGVGVRFLWGYNCFVRRVEFKFGQTQGSSVIFSNCNYCQAVACITEHAPQLVIVSAIHYAWNSYKVISCFNCTIDGCTDIHGGQSVDITYDDNPSLFTTIKNCTIVSSQDTAVTSHSGAYGVSIIDNTFVNCLTGPCIRSRNCLISGNYIGGQGKNLTSNRGVAVADGWPIESVISNNVIDNFYVGIDIQTYNSIAGGFSDMRLLIDSNRILNCRQGVFSQKDTTGQANAVMSGLVITNNFFSKIAEYGVWINTYVNGVVVNNNTFQGPMDPALSPYGIYHAGDAVNCTFRHNTFIDLGSGAVGLRTGNAISNRTVFPVGTYPTNGARVGPNRFLGVIGTNITQSEEATKPYYYDQTIGVGDEYAPRSWVVPADAVALFQRSGNANLYVLSDPAGSTALHFCDSDLATVGGFNYAHASDTMYFRAGGGNRVYLTNTSLQPYTDIAPDLGSTARRWNNFYTKYAQAGDDFAHPNWALSGTIAGSFQKTGGNSAIQVIVNDITSTSGLWFGDLDNFQAGGISYGHSSDSLIFRQNGTNQLQLAANLFYPITDNTLSLGRSTGRWANIYGMTHLVGSANIPISSGAGSPEGVVAAPIGALFLRTDGGVTTTLYVKTSGAATSTGWTAK